MTEALVDNLNFEAAVKELEGMIEKIGSGQLTLEESLKDFERGILLARHCQTALKEAEQKIQILIEQNQNGKTKLEPFHDPLADTD